MARNAPPAPQRPKGTPKGLQAYKKKHEPGSYKPRGNPKGWKKTKQGEKVAKKAVKQSSGGAVISTGYHPRPLQADIHSKLRRFNVLVCHRRFGKTVLTINELIDQALRCQKPHPRFAYLAPLYRQAKQAAWDFLKQYVANIPHCKVYESELRVDLFNGARIQLFGADNPDALRGMYMDGVVLDEYAQMPDGVWTQIIRPMLSDREGWAIFIGTPKGRNAFCDLYESALARMNSEEGEEEGRDWYATIYRASETGVLNAGELSDMRREMSEDEYEQELECSFSAAIVGAYYGQAISYLERDHRIRDVPYDPALPVHSGWDLGIGDSTSIWFAQWINNSEIHIIDYYENAGQGLDHYVKVLQDKGYIYGDHYFPHDVEAKELGTGLSRLEQLENFGIQGEVIPMHRVDDGINQVRMTLPKCYFDKVRTGPPSDKKRGEVGYRGGLEALRQYKKKWDDKNGAFRATPHHDWASHAADAFRYLCMGLKDPARNMVFAGSRRINTSMQPAQQTEYDMFRW
jgi:hypothetical protein